MSAAFNNFRGKKLSEDGQQRSVRKTALEEMTPRDVATELGMTRHAVIVARCAVLGKLRELAGEFLD